MSAREPSAPAPLSILVVEDEAIVSRDLEVSLAGLGYHVAGAIADAASAVLAAERLRPDLVLMDIRLRGPLDGVEAARTIWERFAIPVIFLTAYADEETISRVRTALPFGFLVKPFLTQQLRPAIEVAVHRHRSDREARQSATSLRRAFGALSEAVVIADAQARITWANASAGRLAGCGSETLAGMHLGDLLPAYSPAAGPAQGTAVLGTVSGGEVRVEFCGAPLDLEDGSGCVLTFRAASLASAEHDGRAARAALSALVLGLADHAREPLRALSSTLELVEMRGDADAGTLGNNLSVPLLRRQVERIRNLVQYLVQFAGADGLAADVLPIQDLLEAEIERMRPLSRRYGVTLRIDNTTAGVLSADRDRLLAALDAMVENAVQVSPTGGEVTLRAEPKAGGGLTLTVTDHGPGFAPADLPHVFEPFFTRREGGTGMGLSLARRVADMHGGSLTAANASSGGARVTLEIPGYRAS